LEADAELAAGSAGMALFGLVWVLGGLALAPIAVVLARRIYPGRVVFFARWGFLHLLAVVLVGVGALFLAGVAALPLRWLELPDILTSLAVMALAMALVCAFIALLASRLDPDGVACLGFRRHGSGRAALAGFLGYVLLFPAVMGLGMLWPWLMGYLELEFEPQAVTVGILSLSGPELVIAALGAVIVIPLFEEIIFRGFLQPLLVQNLGDRGGLTLTSAIFAALHGASAFLPIFGLSLVIGAAMLRTQRLAAPWLVHATHNGLMLAMLLLFPEARDMFGQET
jgi:membrane protease YdiL (CAAX protease family)